MGMLNENEQKLDFLLGLTVEKFLERRLQTRVFQVGSSWGGLGSCSSVCV